MIIGSAVYWTLPVHSVLKPALEHAVREEEIPRNVARNVRTGTPRPRRFEPLTADEARQCNAIDTLSTALGSPETTKMTNGNGGEPPPCPALVR